MSRPFYARGYTMKICKQIIAESAVMAFEYDEEKASKSLGIPLQSLKNILEGKDEQADNTTENRPSSGTKVNRKVSKVSKK